MLANQDCVATVFVFTNVSFSRMFLQMKRQTNHCQIQNQTMVLSTTQHANTLYIIDTAFAL